MKTLIITIMLLIVLLTVPNKAESDTDVPYYIYNAANAFKLDIDLLYAICKIESNCRTNIINHNDGTKAQKQKGIISKSYGMFQMQLSTAKWLGFKDKEIIILCTKRHGKLVISKKVVDHTNDLLKPEVNTWYAAKYLNHLYKRYHDTNKVLSAYNGGKYMKYNISYVNKVLLEYVKHKMGNRFYATKP